jgi:hypothetical protein
LAILSSNWKRSKANVAAYSEAVGLALKNPAWATEQLVDFLKTRIEVARGQLEKFSEFNVLVSDLGNAGQRWGVSFEWLAQTYGNGQETDTVQLFLYNMSDNRVEATSPIVARNQSQVAATFENLDVTKMYVVFPMFKSLNGLLSADANFEVYNNAQTLGTCV